MCIHIHPRVIIGFLLFSARKAAALLRAYVLLSLSFERWTAVLKAL
jgi:hypothetical protein